MARVSLEEKANSLGPASFRRPEAAAGRGLCAGRRSGTVVSGRADDGPRSAIAAATVGDHPRVPRRRPHRAAHHALHGRGRTAVRSRGDRRSRQSDRAGHAARIDRQPRGRTRDRIHARVRRRNGLDSRANALPTCRPSVRPAPRTATSAFLPANPTSPCRRCWTGWNRSIAGSPA